MKKKLISAILCSVLAAVSIVSASAVEADNPASGASLNYKIIGETTLPDKTVMFTKSGENVPASTKFIFVKINSYEIVESQQFDFTTDSVYKSLPSESGYNYQLNGGGNRNNVINFTNTGGVYQKIRIKLSDFSSYFNEDGTHTKQFFDNPPHDFNFTDEGTTYFSKLVFISGGAITAVSPDSNGYAELYISTNLGERTFFMTDFSYNLGTSAGGGGGTTGSTFAGFTIGDVDKSGYISLSDAILLQKYQLGMEALDELSLRNADVNRDGKINLKDTVNVQKFKLGIE
ncbi:MAG: dockerin type I repeat-containing protein [Acutalibacteraceae bacterium]